MAKNTFIVAEVPGAKRTSVRVYTHAIIGRRDPRASAVHYASDLRVNEARYRRHDAKHWDDEQRASIAVIGQPYVNHNNYVVPAKDYNIEFGQRFIAEHPVRAAYIAGGVAKRQEHLEELKLGTAGPLVVLQWSMSRRNAEKAVGTWCSHNSEVRVVECHPAPSKAAKAA